MCHKLLTDETKLPPEIRDQIYRPREHQQEEELAAFAEVDVQI